MTCLYLHFLLPDLLNLFILSFVSAIILISPVVTGMLSSNGKLSNRQQCFPNRIISYRKIWDGKYSCWASGGLWLQHWTALGDTWAGTARVYSLMFLLHCVASTFPSQETVNSVFDNPLCEGLFQELSLPLGMDDRTRWKYISYILLQSDHVTCTSSTK